MAKKLRNVFNGFGEVTPKINISRSVIPMNPTIQTSANLGELVPFFCIECIAGDGFSLTQSTVEYLTNLKRPIMGNINTDYYYFFVPLRLLWKNFEQFFGAEKGPSAWTSDSYKSGLLPKLVIGESHAVRMGDLLNHFGLPAGFYGEVNALPMRAYAHIVNDWFMNQNVESPQVDCYDVDGPTSRADHDSESFKDRVISSIYDSVIGAKPWVAYKYADVFTRALRAPQKGAAVTMSIGAQTADVVTSAVTHSVSHDLILGASMTPDGQKIETLTQQGNLGFITDGSSGTSYVGKVYNSPSSSVSSGRSVAPLNLVANLDGISTFSVNQLRTAFAIQKILERYARAGCNRFIEVLRAIYGVSPADYRLQRAEYIGGSRHAVQIQSIAQTSETASTPLGHLSAYSKTVNSGDSWHYECQEPGYIIGLMVSRQNHVYSQLVPDIFKVKSRFDFYNPALANIGEQPISTHEIYWKAPVGNTFGYQEAWWQYRYYPSQCSSMISPVSDDGSNPLTNWSIADVYTGNPTLSPNFLKETPIYLDRALQFPHYSYSDGKGVHQFIFDIYLNITAHRPMPAYSVPGFIDHN